MTVENIKRMLDAFYMAKRISDMLPLLPEGVAPSYIRYLDIIEKLKKKKGQVRVSDLSDMMNVQRPGVTRTVREMEEKGYLKKAQSSDDARVTYIEITRRGRELSRKYNEEVFTALIPSLSLITDDDVEKLVRTTTIFYKAMCPQEEER